MFEELSVSCDASGHDLLTILQTIGKYALIGQRRTEKTKAATMTTDGTKQTTIVGCANRLWTTCLSEWMYRRRYVPTT